jgi:hypothetical protein
MEPNRVAEPIGLVDEAAHVDLTFGFVGIGQQVEVDPHAWNLIA